MRCSPVLASLLLAVVATAATAQDAVLLRIAGAPGSSNRYQGVMDMFVRGGQMAAMMSPDTTLPMTRISTFNTRTLAAVAGDTLVFSEVVDSVRFEAPAMPQMAAMLGSAANQMRGQITQTRMDARGRVFGFVTMNPNAAAGRGRGMGGGGGGGQRTMFILPAQAVRVGETWNDSMHVAASSETEPATNLVATFKLERVDNRGGIRVAVVSMNGSMAQAGGPQGDVRFAMTGEFQLDLNNSRLAGVNMTLTGTLNSPQMGEMPVKMQMTQSLMP
jgi:hypothetical protein